MLKFTTIIHKYRQDANMSMNEYVLVDTIHHLSRGRWCNMSRETMSREYGISKRGIINIIERLISDGWIEKNSEGALKTTEKWCKLVYADSEESAPILVKKVHRSGEESAPNIYIDNNIISTIEETKVSNEEESILDVPNKRIVRAQRSDINGVLSTIKDCISSKGFAYSNMRERIWASNLLKSSEWNKLVEESGGDSLLLIRNIMEYANEDVFWTGKITSAMAFYYKFAILSNQMKTKGLFKRLNAKEDEERIRKVQEYLANL